MNGYYDKVVEQLKQNGYRILRNAKGSHEMWGNGTRNVTVPRHCKSRHTANEIMKQASIQHKF